MFSDKNEPNIIYNKSLNNPQLKEFYSSQMNNQKYKKDPLISDIYQYQLFSSYTNNNNNIQNNPQYKTLEPKTNITDDYYYKYTPSNNINNNNNNFIFTNSKVNETNNNNEQILSSNILTSNKKNYSLNSQISQEIDRQKLKFDEMVERAKYLNNSDNFEFDLKKYLPKETSFENSKALRKYKDLIKPNNLNKYNCFSSRNNNFEKKLKNEKFNYDDIKDNSLSEIPIKNENLFEDELSKSELNFNIQSPCKNDLNNKANQENKQNTNDKINNEKIEQNYLKKNLLINKDNDIIYNKNNLKNENLPDNININIIEKNKNLNNIINNSPNNSDICFKNNLNINDEHINSNLKEYNIDNVKYSIEKPFFNVYYEKKDLDNNEIKSINEDYDEDNLNEIEKTNIELLKNNKNIKNNKINEYTWFCLDYSDDNQDKIFKEFFNSDIE